MTRLSLMALVCLALLCAGAALATPTPQQKCDSTRITAWKTYVSCVDMVVAKDAKGVTFDEFATFAKCRHTYFNKWKTLQTKPYAGSTCIGSRFVPTDSGATVTDGLTGLVWELKTNSGVHNGSDLYSWSTVSNAEDGTAFTTFLTTDLNVAGFAGANGWRMPTLAELQTTVLDFPCTKASCACPQSPCIDGTFGPTQSHGYWSATSNVPDPFYAWLVSFSNGDVNFSYDGKTTSYCVRAVRGGL